MKPSTCIEFQSLHYRRHLVKRMLSVACHRFNRLAHSGIQATRKINGKPMRLHLNDYTQCFFYFGISCEPENIALLGAIGAVANGDLIDVGANYGQLAYELQGSFKNILLFEPNPNAAAFLRQLFADASNIHIEEAAASDREDYAVLSFPDEEQSGVATVKTGGEGPRIRLISIDKILQGGGIAPCVIKIDVEGFEESVLRGAQRTIREYLPILAWEVNDKGHFIVCKKLLPDSWNFYRIDTAMEHGLHGLRKVASIGHGLIAGSSTWVTKVDDVIGPISLVFAVPPEREQMFGEALARLAQNGVKF